MPKQTPVRSHRKPAGLLTPSITPIYASTYLPKSEWNKENISPYGPGARHPGTLADTDDEDEGLRKEQRTSRRMESSFLPLTDISDLFEGGGGGGGASASKAKSCIWIESSLSLDEDERSTLSTIDVGAGGIGSAGASTNGSYVVYEDEMMEAATQGALSTEGLVPAARSEAQPAGPAAEAQGGASGTAAGSPAPPAFATGKGASVRAPLAPRPRPIR